MAVLVYEGEITDEIIKNYEISRTEYSKVQLKDGTEYTLHFGMQKPGTSSCFAVVEEMNKVYLMNSTYKDSIIITKENLLHTTDVYKRQDIRIKQHLLMNYRIAGAVRKQALQPSEAVSYTHLDVYKRQI